MKLVFRFSVLAAAIASSGAIAQNKTELVVVTASRTAESVAETLRDVSVIRGDDLVRAGVSDIATALQSVAGVEVLVQGPGATPSIFVRGGNSNQVLVLIDGQRMGSSFSGQSAIQHIAVSQIDRIEVVRGPAASLYGADAVSGVIQIFTKRGSGMSANVAAGNQRASDVSARAGFSGDGHSFSISANHRESRGHSAIVNPGDFSFNPDRDGYRFSSVQANASVKLMPSLTLEGSVFAARGNAQYDGDASFDDRVKSDVRNASAKFRFAPSARWNSSLSIGQSADQASFISSFPGEFKTTQEQLSWQNNVRVNRDVSLWNALEWRGEKVASLDGLDVTSRKTSSAVVGGDVNLSPMKIAASVRLDDSRQYGSRNTGNVAASYALNGDWRVLMNAGTSFKAPTFNDLYYPGFANPLLAPERAKNVDMALQWSRAASTAKIVVYENRVRDLIQFVCDANFNCAPQNVSKASLRGATLSAATRVAQWNVEASLDAADPKNLTTGKQLARRAKLHGALKVSGDVLGVTTGMELVASEHRFDNASNTRRLAGYGVVNWFARHELANGLSLGVRLENALDRDYQTSSGYATGGRRGWITLSYSQR
ncbi:MAG: TonB-dependent receptor [Betaproteobacteria bacterium]|nr:MAG: TonB-dependent receptor [Betaproteobacteria bacterium]